MLAWLCEKEQGGRHVHYQHIRLFYGLSLINVAITVSLLLLYLRRLKAQYDKLLEKRVEEAVRDTRELCMWKQTGECLGQPEGRERGEEHQE
ncbi:MAG: hypothetical protein ACI36Y_00505 [Coriobacteriales bacterium]